MKTILIFAYYSFKDVIFQSAVLPYFLDFPESDSHRFVLITFEQKHLLIKEDEEDGIRKFLNSHHIIWYKLKWNSGNLKILKKVFDFIQSITVTSYLIYKYKVKIIYSEGFPGAILGHFISQITGRKHIIHTYEPHADYMFQSGIWKADSWEYRLLKKFEIKVAMAASAILTATDKMILELKASGSKATMMRTPSCVDLSLFEFSSRYRKHIRKILRIEDHELLLVYLGKVGGMYWDHELFRLFNSFKKFGKHSYKFLILSIDAKDKILSFNEFNGLEQDITIMNVDRKLAPQYLSAGDCGICGIRNIPSRRYSSPIKNGEYWACGLPVIIPEGISDDYFLTRHFDLGIILKNDGETAFKEAVYSFEKKIFSKSWQDIKVRSRNFVMGDRNVAVFRRKYNELFNQIFNE